MFVFDPDPNLAQLGELFLRHEDRDPLEVVGQHLEGVAALILVCAARRSCGST